jgi:hypothetical protein
VAKLAAATPEATSDFNCERNAPRPSRAAISVYERKNLVTAYHPPNLPPQLPQRR